MNPTSPSQNPPQEPSPESSPLPIRKKPIDKAMIVSWGISIACCSVFLLIAALIVINVMQEEKETEIAYEHAPKYPEVVHKPAPPTNNPIVDLPTPEPPPEPVVPTTTNTNNKILDELQEQFSTFEGKGDTQVTVYKPKGPIIEGPLPPDWKPTMPELPRGIPSARCDKADRLKRLKKFGGKESTEDAVVKALDWLKTVQNQDGSWGDKYKGAMTGLALLSYLGHCEKQDSPKYGDSVKRGILYLLELNEKQNGKMYTSKPAYETGIAAYALGEAYIITKNYSPRIKNIDTALQRSISVITKGQKEDGGWDYGYSTAMAKGSDTSVSGWQIQALKVAKLTGLEFEQINMTLDKAMENILRVKGPKGGFGYREPQDKLSLTGVGALALQMWEPEKYRSEITEAVNLVVDTYKRYPEPGDHFNKYGWYYHTQAAYQQGGRQWRDWNKIFQDTLVKKQSSEGFWMDWGHKGHGPDADSLEGKIYTTTLCTLMLEIYYRYLQNTGDDKHAQGAKGLKES